MPLHVEAVVEIFNFCLQFSGKLEGLVILDSRRFLETSDDRGFLENCGFVRSVDVGLRCGRDGLALTFGFATLHTYQILQQGHQVEAHCGSGMKTKRKWQ